MLNLLKSAQDGDLFGHDKISFIIDAHLDQLRQQLLQWQEVLSPYNKSLCFRVVIQLGRVRSNPADYLSCFQSKIDLRDEIRHIVNDLPITIVAQPQTVKEEKQQSFSENLSICKGTLFFQHAGQHKLDFTSGDSLTTDGNDYLYYFKRDKGLYKLSVGDGISKTVGAVRYFNSTKDVAEMDSVSLLYLNDLLYVRHYAAKEQPFEIFDTITLSKNDALSKQWKSHFEHRDPEAEPIHTLQWNKNEKSGRTLEQTPMFTDGTHLYVVCTQQKADFPTLVIESYNPLDNFKFIRAIPLLEQVGERLESFCYDRNSPNIIKTSQFSTNGITLSINIPSQDQHFFDLSTGKKVGAVPSQSVLQCYNFKSNSFYNIQPSTSLASQSLYEVQISNFKKANHSDSEQDRFLSHETQHISNLAKLLDLEKNMDTEATKDVEQIIFGIRETPLPQQTSYNLPEILQIIAQQTLILKYLDVKCAQAFVQIPVTEFIKVFKYPNATYLNCATFGALIRSVKEAAAFYNEQTEPHLKEQLSYPMLYTLRILHVNFNALVKCQGSLQELMKHDSKNWTCFFEVYDTVLKNMANLDPASITSDSDHALVLLQVRKVCTEIITSCINIIYKTDEEVVDKFCIDIVADPHSVDCTIFLENFTKPANCEKLLNPVMNKIMSKIFDATCAVQVAYFQANLLGSQNQNNAYLCSQFIKLYATRLVVSYFNQMEKVADRAETEALQSRHEEEDLCLAQIQEQVLYVFSALGSGFADCLRALRDISEAPIKENDDTFPIISCSSCKRSGCVCAQLTLALSMLLQRTPFTQIQICIYNQIFTSINVKPEILHQVTEVPLLILSLLDEILTKFGPQSQLLQLQKLARSQAYLICSKAYTLAKSNQDKGKEEFDEGEKILLQVIGGIEDCFEPEFSDKARNEISLYTKLHGLKPKQKAECNLNQILEPTEAVLALEQLQAQFKKTSQHRMLATVGCDKGLVNTRCAFAVMLKLLDKESAFNKLVQAKTLDSLEEAPMLFLMWEKATQQMRSWTGSINNRNTDHIQKEVLERFLKKRKMAETEQINTTTLNQNGLTEQEQQQVNEEIDQRCQEEAKQIFDAVLDRAKFLIKMQSPRKKIEEVQLQQDICKVLQMPISVQKIKAHVESSQVAAHKRVAGLHLLAKTISLLTKRQLKRSFQDSVAWFCSALRGNCNINAHFLDEIIGCNETLERAARTYFFQILKLIVDKLGSLTGEDDDEGDAKLLLSSLKWSYQASDHCALSQLGLFKAIQTSPKLNTLWGKPIACEVKNFVNQVNIKTMDVPISRLKDDLKTEFSRFYKEQQLDRERKVGVVADKVNSEETLELPFASRVVGEICHRYQTPGGFNDHQFSQEFRTLTTNALQTETNFQNLFKYLIGQHKEVKSSLAKEMVELIEFVFTNVVGKLQEKKNDITPTEDILDEILEIVFRESQRYLNILQIHKGVDWAIYAQNRGKHNGLFGQNLDGVKLLDIEDVQNKAALVEKKDETEEEKILREALLIQEQRIKQEILKIPKIYSDTFLVRLIRLLEIYVNLSTKEKFAKKVFSKIQQEQLGALITLTVQATPHVKRLVIKILSHFVFIEVPAQLFETTMEMLCKDTNSVVCQILNKVKPCLKFQNSKFLTFLFHYILSIRQKVWVKSAIESEGQYVVSVELARLMRQMYESQTLDSHQWRQEINTILCKVITEYKIFSKSRETEVLLSLIQGADFQALAPYTQVQQDSDLYTLVGFVQQNWVTRTHQQLSDFKIYDQFSNKGQMALAVSTKQVSMKDIVVELAPNQLRVEQGYGQGRFKLNKDLLQKILEDFSLTSIENDDVQVLNNKTMLLKAIKTYMISMPVEFGEALEESGHSDTLLKFVHKVSSKQICGDTTLPDWLEQRCYSIRKYACENQRSLMRQQETQIKLIGGAKSPKFYAAAVNPLANGDLHYFQVKPMSALNFVSFEQKKEIKLVNSTEINLSTEDEGDAIQAENQVALIDPHQFEDGQDGFKILCMSKAAITYGVDLEDLKSKILVAKLIPAYRDLPSKSVFLVSLSSFETLQTLCSGSSSSSKENKQKDPDSVFISELVQYGGFNTQLAQKTKEKKDFLEKTMMLEGLLKKYDEGSIVLEEEAPKIEDREIQMDILRTHQRREEMADVKELREKVREPPQRDEVEEDRDNDDDEEQERDQERRRRQEREEIERRRPKNSRKEEEAISKMVNCTSVNYSEDLASLYESNLRQLFQMQCRQVFWSLVNKKSKAEVLKVISSLLKTKVDMQEFASFLRVLGNECFQSGNKLYIKSFKQYLKLLVQVSVGNVHLHEFIQVMVFEGVIENYRKELDSMVAGQEDLRINTYFQKETRAQNLANPFIILPMLKYLIAEEKPGFDIIAPRIADLISMLITIRNIFSFDRKLEESLWYLVVRLVEHCRALSSEQIKEVVGLKIFKDQLSHIDRVFETECEAEKTLRMLQADLKAQKFDGIAREEPHKISLKELMANSPRMFEFRRKSQIQHTQLELVYKLRQLSKSCPANYFFNNNLTCFVDTTCKLLEQGAYGSLSRYLLWVAKLSLEERAANFTTLELKLTEVSEVKLESEKAFVQVTAKDIPVKYQVCMTSDPEGSRIVRTFNPSQMQSNLAFLNVFNLKKVFLHLADFPKNFTVDLSKEELTLNNYPVQLAGPLLQSDGKYIELPQGIFETVGLDNQPKQRQLLRMREQTQSILELSMLTENSASSQEKYHRQMQELDEIMNSGNEDEKLRRLTELMAKHGIFDEEEQARPFKDHLRYKQVTFGTNCQVMLLPNGKVVGFGQSKYRHFSQQQDHYLNHSEIPLILQKPSKDEDELRAQKHIVQIQTNKHTTVCVTEAGRVYVVGDKFAKLHGIKNDNGGFFSLGLDMTKPEPVAAEEPPVVIPVVAGEVPQPLEVIQEEAEEVPQPVVIPLVVGDVPQPVVAEEQVVVSDGPEKVEIVQDASIVSEKVQEKKQFDEDLSIKVLNSLEQLLPAQPDDQASVEQPLIVEEIQIQINESDDDKLQEEAKHPKEEEEKGERDSEGEYKDEDSGEEDELQDQCDSVDHEEPEEEVEEPVESPTEAKIEVVEETEAPITVKALKVWISRVEGKHSTQSTVILGLFQNLESKEFELRTLGKSNKGLLGLGKDVQISSKFRKVQFGTKHSMMVEPQVYVGATHFFVVTEGTVYAWGQYRIIEDVQHFIAVPTALPFFKDLKVIEIASGNANTSVLVDKDGTKQLIVGRFTPLWQTQMQRTLNGLQNPIKKFFFSGDKTCESLIISTEGNHTMGQALTKLEACPEVPVTVKILPDSNFMESESLVRQHQASYDALQTSLKETDTLDPEVFEDFKKKIQDFVFSLITQKQVASDDREKGKQGKDQNIFDSVKWAEQNISEASEFKMLQEDEKFVKLSETCKRSHIMLFVGYCKHIWGMFSFLSLQRKQTKHLAIMSCFNQFKQTAVPQCLKNRLLQAFKSIEGLLKVNPVNKNPKIKQLTITIDRKKAHAKRVEGQTDSKFEWSVFAKLARQLQQADYFGLMCNSEQDKPWYIVYLGEGGADTGGMQRDSQTELCQELQSSALDLFVTTENTVDKVGVNQDCWTLNPKLIASNSQHLKMFEFVGALFGMAIRSGNLLNLNLSPIVWKLIAQEEITDAALQSDNERLFLNFETMLSYQQQKKPEEDFLKDYQLTMTRKDSESVVIYELIPNGQNVPVTYSNLGTYIELMKQSRKTENLAQVKAIRKGIAATFSLSFLRLLSWSELEVKVVGHEIVDIERLKEISSINSKASKDLQKRFWRVLNSLDNADKIKYMRFVWGRTRLPLPESQHVDHHTISFDDKLDIHSLPTAKTCAFSITLPMYPTEEILKEKLLRAIKECISIESDGNIVESEQPDQVPVPVQPVEPLESRELFDDHSEEEE